MLLLSVGVAARAQPLTTSEDYPVRALREGRQGTVQFRVTVGEAGRVEACQITASSGSADLDAATCEIVSRRGRFKPPTDASGQPAKRIYASKMHWAIPREPPASVAAAEPTHPAEDD